MKYRIKLVVSPNGATYHYVQYKRFLFWRQAYSDGVKLRYSVRGDAYAAIRNMKRNGAPRVEYIPA